MLNFPEILPLNFCNPVFSLAKEECLTQLKKKKNLVSPLGLVCRFYDKFVFMISDDRGLFSLKFTIIMERLSQ